MPAFKDKVIPWTRLIIRGKGILLNTKIVFGILWKGTIILLNRNIKVFLKPSKGFNIDFIISTSF